MNTRMIVNEGDRLQEMPENGLPAGFSWIKWPATLLSYLFHPVFVPVYLVYYLLYGHPFLFAGFSAFDKMRAFSMSVIMYSFFPLVTVLLLRALGFASGFQLRTQRDRIIPLVACGIWYFWIWYVWRNLPDYPRPAVQLALGIWISVSLALLMNIVMKVSLHAISMGVMLGFVFLLSLRFPPVSGGVLAGAVLATGAVCSSRLLVSDHRGREIYGGLFLGLASLLLAAWLG